MIEYRDGIGYSVEKPGEEGWEADDGTMLENIKHLETAIVGHRIVEVSEIGAIPEGDRYFLNKGTMLTLDTGRKVILRETSDCCAFTELTEVIKRMPKTDHIITAVTETEDFNRWHIMAGMDEVLELGVEWSCGNPFYYMYGFVIEVEEGRLGIDV